MKSNINRVFIRGDTHGDYDWLREWCNDNNTTRDDILIILGDSGIRFEGALTARECARKSFIRSMPITIFCVRGNHDRPFVNQWQLDCELVNCPFLDDKNPPMWHDIEYSNIWYFMDYGVYYIKNKSFLIVGGAYSVDKDWRIFNHWTWYPEEQLTVDEWLDLFDLTYDRGFNYVLTHTCPYDWRPTDLFMKSVDQSKIDSTTEEQLQYLSSIISWEHWYWGHFHGDRDYGDGRRMFYNDIIQIL